MFGKDKILLADGAMGTMLQKYGLKKGMRPEEMNLCGKDTVLRIHREYSEAGADIITANTFGANRVTLADSALDVREVIKNAVWLAKTAAPEKITAFDMGPTGKLLAPMGALEFEEAFAAYYEAAREAAAAGADLILIETMSDLLEIKAAVLAAKEACRLPVFAAMTFDANRKTLTGCDIPTMVFTLEGLRVDALGINCGLGPAQIRALTGELLSHSSLPALIQPNAGLPKIENGQTVYDLTPDEFAGYMRDFALSGAGILGGCCGTTPEHIRRMAELCANLPKKPVKPKNFTAISSYCQSAILGERLLVIGERINPTGKKVFKEALKDNDIDYITGEAINQHRCGADILDVNVGLPEIDEAALLPDVVKRIQAVCPLPLQLDSASPAALENAMRVYAGKPMVNSVNGKAEVMDAVFPLVQKYGGALVALTLDESGIPPTAQGRLEIAQRIVREAAKYGIEKKDIIVDTLCMAVAADRTAAKITLESLSLIKRELGVKTVLGVSNVSFALPDRPVVNAAFLSLARQAGLDCAIVNPCAPEAEIDGFALRMLMGEDPDCKAYIESRSHAEKKEAARETFSLGECVRNGQKDSAKAQTLALLETMPPLDIINREIIPALNFVGDEFEAGRYFLPQLMSSADAAKAAFDAIKERTGSGGVSDGAPIIVIATVEGDIHDIGKNIVKMMLQNYGYNVVDLGKNVPVMTVVEAAKENNAALIGLSALMTTTVFSMEKTIAALKENGVSAPVMVGGAVLTEDYAKKIGADYYAKDALASVEIAKRAAPAGNPAPSSSGQ